MGTRADFYVGEGKDAEWIGSVAWDGYEWGELDGEPNPIADAKTEEEYRKAVSEMFAERDDATTPEMGWPWPWEDSCTTDCAYCFVGGAFKAFSWGCFPYGDENAERCEWPDFSGQYSAEEGSKRSGVIVVSA